MQINKKAFFKYRILVLVMASLMISFLFFTGAVRAMEQINDSNGIILIGASVGKGWDFPDLPHRIGIKNRKLEYIGVFDTFDKSSALEKILERTIKPKVVIIKECSVYFPGDIKSYKIKIKKWVSNLQRNNIEPVLATTVPVGKSKGIVYRLKNIVRNVIGKKNKGNAITEYNEWICDYAAKNGIKILDLERALRLSDDNRYLDPKYDRGDFTHLNKDAYLILDIVMGDLLKQI